MLGITRGDKKRTQWLTQKTRVDDIIGKYQSLKWTDSQFQEECQKKNESALIEQVLIIIAINALRNTTNYKTNQLLYN